MIIFKRKHLSIKWGIFAGILVFLAILLLLLFLLQTVYLDDIYKAAKKNTLNNANDKVEQVLEKQLGNLNVIEQQHFYKRAEKNGGGFTEEIAGDIQRDPFDLFKGNEIYLDQKPPSGIAQESMVSVRILTNQQYTISYNCKRTPHTSKCHRADDSSGTNICLYYYDYFGTRAGYGDLTPHLKAAKPDE